jgi:hypothetical protein
MRTNLDSLAGAWFVVLLCQVRDDPDEEPAIRARADEVFKKFVSLGGRDGR